LTERATSLLRLTNLSVGDRPRLQ